MIRHLVLILSLVCLQTGLADDYDGIDSFFDPGYEIIEPEKEEEKEDKAPKHEQAHSPSFVEAGISIISNTPGHHEKPKEKPSLSTLDNVDKNSMRAVLKAYLQCTKKEACLEVGLGKEQCASQCLEKAKEEAIVEDLGDILESGHGKRGEDFNFLLRLSDDGEPSTNKNEQEERHQQHGPKHTPTEDTESFDEYPKFTLDR